MQQKPHKFVHVQYTIYEIIPPKPEIANFSTKYIMIKVYFNEGGIEVKPWLVHLYGSNALTKAPVQMDKLQNLR